MHKEFIQKGQTVNAVFYLGVKERLLTRIRRVRPEYREKVSWRLLEDNASANRLTLRTDLSTKNGILTLNHSAYTAN